MSEDKKWSDADMRSFGTKCKIEVLRNFGNCDNVVDEQLREFKATSASKQPIRDWEITAIIEDGYDKPRFKLDGYNPELIKRDTIWQVKRSDGEVFSVGDELTDLGYRSNETHTIKSIQLINGTVGLNYTDTGASIIIQAAKKVQPKPVLFTTVDGKNACEGDSVWALFDFVSRNRKGMITYPSFAIAAAHLKDLKETPLFSTKEAAEDYSLMNQTILSLNDLLSVWDIAVTKDEATLKYFTSAPLFLNFKKKAQEKLAL